MLEGCKVAKYRTSPASSEDVTEPHKPLLYRRCAVEVPLIAWHRRAHASTQNRERNLGVSQRNFDTSHKTPLGMCTITAACGLGQSCGSSQCRAANPEVGQQSRAVNRGGAIEQGCKQRVCVYLTCIYRIFTVYITCRVDDENPSRERMR